MAGTLHKMAVYLGLVEEDLDADYTTDEPRSRSRESYQPDGQDVRPRPGAEAPASSIVTTGAIPPVRAASPIAKAVAERPAPTAAAPAPGTVAAPTPTVVPQLHRPTVSAAPRPAASAVAEVPRIVTLHPRSYNDARRIGEEYREGLPVIVNLTGMEDVDAKRIVDFAAGLIFGLRGSIERITNKVFLLSPAHVDVGAEARALIAQDGFFTQS